MNADETELRALPVMFALHDAREFYIVRTVHPVYDIDSFEGISGRFDNQSKVPGRNLSLSSFSRSKKKSFHHRDKRTALYRY